MAAPIIPSAVFTHNSERSGVLDNQIQERLSLLDMLASRVNNHEVLQSLKETFSKQDIHVPILRGHYSLHHKLADLTDQLRDVPELKTIWESFLKSLKGVTITYDADDTKLEFDVTEELDRLNGNLLPYTIECLNPRSPHFQYDLDQIFIEERECCGISRQYSREKLEEVLSNTDKFICYIARRTTPSYPLGQILGHGYAIKEKIDDGQVNLHGYGFGRRAFASKLGVGKRIFEGFANQELARYKRIFIEVRESNRPAIALYEKMGFVYEKTLLNVYPQPVENALVMVLDPSRLAVLLNKTT